MSHNPHYHSDTYSATEICRPTIRSIAQWSWCHRYRRKEEVYSRVNRPPVVFPAKCIMLTKRQLDCLDSYLLGSKPPISMMDEYFASYFFQGCRQSTQSSKTARRPRKAEGCRPFLARSEQTAAHKARRLFSSGSFS